MKGCGFSCPWQFSIIMVEADERPDAARSTAKDGEERQLPMPLIAAIRLYCLWASLSGMSSRWWMTLGFSG